MITRFIGVLLAAALAAGLCGFTSASAATTQHTTWGVTLSGLQTDLGAAQADSPDVSGISNVSMQGMYDQISAAAGFWHANTVRLQVEQAKLVGTSGHSYSPAYMSTIENVVSYARSLGLTVVINDQTEPAPGFTANEPLPTHATHVFCQKISAVYKNRAGIIYDLFNEPRGRYGWGAWKSAMQSALNAVRATGAQNTVWIEGIHFSNNLAGMPLLHGGSLVYTFHHPAGSGKAAWFRDFGYLASHVKVIDGEWWGATMPPAGYLAYLHKYHVGLTGWTLNAGSMSTAAGYNTATPSGQALRASFDK